jgi:hypothetical protein
VSTFIEAGLRPDGAGAACDRPEPGRSWLRGLGVAGFLFFLVKGLLWLALPLLVAALR